MKRTLVIAVAALVLLPGANATTAANCSGTSVAMAPLTDMGARRTYRGYHGGLYARGANKPSTAYLKAGLAAAKKVHPIDGKIVLLSIGMSNTTMEFSAFKRLADSQPAKAGAVQLVDGAQGGQDAEIIKDPSARFWSVVEQRVTASGATDAQVQAVWLKEAIARPTEAFPADALRLQRDLAAIVAILRAKFANLQLVYVSSRTYGGYASTNLNPEPFAYESGFAVKWLVLQRAKGKLRGPWIGWGPYFWTNGEKGRKDGLTWTCADTRPSDGTHPSTLGVQKTTRLLWQFFATDATARRWFTSPSG